MSHQRRRPYQWRKPRAWRPNRKTKRTAQLERMRVADLVVRLRAAAVDAKAVRQLSVQADIMRLTSTVEELLAIIDDLCTCVVCFYAVNDDEMEAVVNRAAVFLERDPFDERERMEYGEKEPEQD